MINPINQRDKQWKDIKIGNSNSTIGNYGCTISCLSMQAGITPIEFNERMTKVNGFQVDKILWQKINEAIPWLKFPDMGRHYSYDNNIVSQAIANNGSCLVEVDFDGIISTPNDSHWILYIGNGQAIDPWTGYIISTNKYPLVKGFCVIEVKTQINSLESNMTDEQKKVLNDITVFYKSIDELKSGNLEGACNALIGAYKDITGYKETITNQSKEIEILKGKIGDLQVENKNLNSEVKGLQLQLRLKIN